MMHNQVALGIDISDSRISMALLRRTRNGAKVLRGCSASVPDGAIKDGCIENVEALAKAIRDLKSRHRMRASKAAISLPAASTIVHILEAPRGAPSNIGKFVQKELKSYIILSGKEIVFDYCGIKSNAGSTDRLFAVAAGQDELDSVLSTCTRARLDVGLIEPAMLSYVRALYAERIEARFDDNVLITILQGTVLTLCVFKKQTLDFVRVEHAVEGAEPGELCAWLADKINSIIKFYDIDVPDSSGKWEVTVVADNVQLPDNAQALLSAEVTNAAVEIRTGENACQDAFVDQKKCKGKPSAAAIGLAVGLLEMSQNGLRVNLVPPESAEVKAAKRQLVLTAVVVVVAIPLLMIAAGMGLKRLADQTRARIQERKRTELSKDTSASFKELTNLNRQIDLLSKRPAERGEILNSRPALGWEKILNDVRVRTPKSVRITELYTIGDTGVIIKGLALSYEAARLFEKTLNESDYIEFASLAETSREDNVSAFVEYKINCSLNTGKIKI